MDPAYFRALARRCSLLSGQLFELKAKEEFRKLADEFAAKAAELERAHASQSELPRRARARTTDANESHQQTGYQAEVAEGLNADRK
jgi:hypothetical protein